MNALTDTCDGLDLGGSGDSRPRGLGLLNWFVKRIAAEDREALRRFPEEEDVRLSLHALGRGFDSM